MINDERMKKIIRSKGKRSESSEKKQMMLGTGSTLLNIAITGGWRGGLATGGYYFFVGDSSSGKTFLTLTCFAEAAQSKAFNEYRFIYDDVEGGALMDFAKFFGQRVADRVEPPAGSVNEPLYSQTIEEFYFNLDNALASPKPCIYVLDSMDALSSKYEERKFDEKKKASETGGKAKGDYGDGKAKINSAMLRVCLGRLRETGSILIIINQTRDNINAGLFESKKTRSGGHALTFYATVELWSSVGGKIKKTVKNKDRQIGITSRINVKKNRLTGRVRSVEVPIYYEYGIDDLGSCVDYLIEEGVWVNKSGNIAVTEIVEEPTTMKKASLIKFIEAEGLEDDVRILVNKTWNDVEAACSMGRKKRYE